MALRKQILKDTSDIPSGSQQIIDENTQEDEPDDNDELSSSLLPAIREKRKRERQNKSKEMTEEEMMDMALRLSEQEASVTALRQQQEEEAMMKAIQESMVSQTQPCPPSQSQSLLSDAEASLRFYSRRKLLYSNRKMASAVNHGASGDVCTPETDLSQGAKGTGDESNNRNKKRKRKEGSPLLEMPDLSQTQKINSQASPPCSLECLSVSLDSPQSSDSTQIEDCQLRKSPVFPSSADCRAEVTVSRLSKDLLETCRSSGFVLCSQDSGDSTQKSAQPESPTFPKSPKPSSDLILSKSPVFSESDRGDDGETEPSPEHFKSPVFGRNTQHETSPSACKPQLSVFNSGFSSLESSTSPVRSATCRPKSPVFPRSLGLPKNLPPPERSASPVFSETGGGQTEQSRGCRTSPVFGKRPGRRQKSRLDEQKDSVCPSAAELRGSDSEGSSTTTTRDPPQSLRQGSKTDPDRDVGFNKSSKSDKAEEELNKKSKDWNSAETELTSDMTLICSDEDDAVTPVGSPSPVFPEERPVHQADSQDASPNHVTAASPGMNCRPSTSSTSTGRQQLSTTEREPRPISSQGTAGRASAGGPTVHYYWGVPFCPRGVDPDKYTQVILDQMEVYEKSLKQAQRGLLTKAEWGEAVLPQLEKSPSPESPAAESPQQLVLRRRGIRMRGRKLCEAADSPPAEAEEDEEDKKDEEDGEERESKEEEKQKEEAEEEGRVDTDDCEVCPETQLSNDDDDRTQDLMMATDAGAEFECKKSPEVPEVELILRDDSPTGNELQEEEEEMEVDAPADRKTKGNVPVSSSSDVGGQHVRKEMVEKDVEEIRDRVLQRSTSPELEPAVVSQRRTESKVDCPICQGSFPVTEIERHAAYCDGEVAVVDERRPERACFQVSLKPRRKRTRRADSAAEETDEPSNTGKNQEKCYVCQRAVPLKDYGRHTELCIRQSKTVARGNLLSALEQTESRDSEAGPSGSRLQPGDVIDLRDDDDDEEEEGGGGVSALRISDSPIRSFTPISEATGCLIDFKKQHRTKKLRQRRR
ncbi:BRCA1-A complex subunit RAP80 isoform X1 [Sebastes umbrosus]|uniref:BRCA1-A complex subunit RAP80 isoform X1 n=2 Tax=Sebastes umbrosus TaxID=72105 RepID=UPI00189FF0F3|nr:BRCA1-A complex subunit RAP80 isoform X1 [Sebastes umbrosus]XP_037604644.1 BRCA1-A complex subunit RAP80 isoform X1 [Sebastes umbrosus]XP_037604645.1 BRCA1-A complex subunit RAP80 isoform X1 [Sebastes umbrosus]XP_037604646.1 BRCA1-A complex subunit RAP80 isoform X1 [Sebastes umbrosus]